MRQLNRQGNIGYKLLLLILPSVASLIALTLYLYPRWPRGKATIKEKVAAVFTNAVHEAIQKELKAALGTAPVQSAVQTPAVQWDSPASDEPVNITAKGTKSGIEFYTDKEGSGCKMHVDTSPSGASVILNGSIVGTTPIDLRGGCDTPFNLKLDKPNYLSVERTLAYKQGASVALRMQAVETKPAAPSKNSDIGNKMTEWMDE